MEQYHNSNNEYNNHVVRSYLGSYHMLCDHAHISNLLPLLHGPGRAVKSVFMSTQITNFFVNPIVANIFWYYLGCSICCRIKANFVSLSSLYLRYRKNSCNEDTYVQCPASTIILCSLVIISSTLTTKMTRMDTQRVATASTWM